MHKRGKTFLIVFALGTLATGAWAGQARGMCPAPVLAMTYNIRLDTPADGENAWTNRRDFLTGQIELLRPALLGMQEVLPNQRGDLQAALKGYSFVGGGRDDGKLAGEASPLAIDDRVFRIRSSGTFWLSPTPLVPSRGWDAALPRIATWAHLSRKSDDTRMLAINTHWDHVGNEARIESGRQLARWIAANRGRDEAVILLGDLNTGADDPAVAGMVDTAGLLSTASEQEARGSGGAPPSTFNGYDAVPQPGRVIDHIFVSRAVGVLRGMVLALHRNGRVASDHFPVAALLRLPAGDREVPCAARQAQCACKAPSPAELRK
ncbi:MAG: endonuclease/exonuclease/phosphatase family protein [Erythrobacter sp.]